MSRHSPFWGLLAYGGTFKLLGTAVKIPHRSAPTYLSRHFSDLNTFLSPNNLHPSRLSLYVPLQEGLRPFSLKPWYGMFPFPSHKLSVTSPLHKSFLPDSPYSLSLHSTLPWLPLHTGVPWNCGHLVPQLDPGRAHTSYFVTSPTLQVGRSQGRRRSDPDHFARKSYNKTQLKLPSRSK